MSLFSCEDCGGLDECNDDCGCLDCLRNHDSDCLCEHCSDRRLDYADDMRKGENK